MDEYSPLENESQTFKNSFKIKPQIKLNNKKITDVLLLDVDQSLKVQAFRENIFFCMKKNHLIVPSLENIFQKINMSNSIS